MVKKLKQVKFDKDKGFTLKDLDLMREYLDDALVDLINQFEEMTGTTIKQIEFIEDEDDQPRYIRSRIELWL